MTQSIHIVNTTRDRIRKTWWMLLAQGVVALLAGTLLVTNADASLRAFAPFLGLFWLIGGLLDVLEAVTERDDGGIWRWSALGGSLGVLAGVLWLSRPVLNADTLPVWLSLIIAAATIAGGGANIVWAWRLRDKIEGEGWMILWGAVSIILGIWIVGAPFISADIWILLAAFCALISGVGLVVWAVALARRHRVLDLRAVVPGLRLPLWLVIGGAIVVAVMAGGVWFFGEIQLASAAPLGVRLSASAQRGQAVFQLHCAACHNAGTQMKYGPGLAGLFEPGGPALPRGVDYAGRLPNGKDITPVNTIEWLRSGGRAKIGVMPPVGIGMSDEELTDVIAFLAVLKK